MSLSLKRIHYYVLISFFRPFLLTFSIGLFFLQLQFLYRHLGELVGKGVDIGVIAEMMLYVSAALLPFNFPLSILLASVITFGTLGENYELVAMKSAGISLTRILAPLFCAVGIMVMVAFFVANNVIPETNIRYMTILKGLQQQQPELILQDGVFSNEINGYSIKVETVDKKTNELFDIIFYNHKPGENDGGVTVAPYGTISVTPDKRFVVLHLFNGVCYQEGKGMLGNLVNDKKYYLRTSFDEQVMRIRIYNFDFALANENVFANHHRMLGIRDLNVAIDSLKNDCVTLLNSYKDKMNVNIGITSRNVNAKDLVPGSYPGQMIKTLSEKEKIAVIQCAQTDVRNNISSILKVKQQFRESQKTLRQYQIEKHRKITLSLAIFIFFLIGSSFGAVVRKGGISLPVVFCFTLLVIYFVIGLLGERMILSGVLSLFVGIWLPFFVLVPIAAWLTWLSVNDSTIIVSETWQGVLKRLQGNRK